MLLLANISSLYDGIFYFEFWCFFFRRALSLSESPSHRRMGRSGNFSPEAPRCRKWESKFHSIAQIISTYDTGYPTVLPRCETDGWSVINSTFVLWRDTYFYANNHKRAKGAQMVRIRTEVSSTGWDDQLTVVYWPEQ